MNDITEKLDSILQWIEHHEELDKKQAKEMQHCKKILNEIYTHHRKKVKPNE